MSSDLLLDSGRFWSKVAGGPVEECWVWTAARNPQGYGTTTYRIDGKVRPQSAHRVAYRLLRGDPTPGLTLDHLCENPPCVNPWHLEEVPLGLNIGRSRTRGQRGGICMDPKRAPRSHAAIKPGYRLVFERIENQVRTGELSSGDRVPLPINWTGTPSLRALISWLTLSGLAVDRSGVLHVAEDIPAGPLVVEREFEPMDAQAPQDYSGRSRFMGDPGIYIALPTNDLLWATTAEYRSLTFDEMWDELLRYVPEPGISRT